MLKRNAQYIKVHLTSPERIVQWSKRVMPNGMVIGEVKRSVCFV
jgi:hypothetical protein